VSIVRPEIAEAAVGAEMIGKGDAVGWLPCLSWSAMVKLMVLPDKRLHEEKKREASSRAEVE